MLIQKSKPTKQKNHTTIQLIIKISKMKTNKIDQVDMIKHKSISRKVDQSILKRKLMKHKKHYKQYLNPD